MRDDIARRRNDGIRAAKAEAVQMLAYAVYGEIGRRWRGLFEGIVQIQWPGGDTYDAVRDQPDLIVVEFGSGQSVHTLPEMSRDDVIEVARVRHAFEFDSWVQRFADALPQPGFHVFQASAYYGLCPPIWNGLQAASGPVPIKPPGAPKGWTES